jgi:hypothetical protein
MKTFNVYTLITKEYLSALGFHGSVTDCQELIGQT